MWIKANPNPMNKEVPDCVIRAVCIALNIDWYQAFDEICAVARDDCNMPSADTVWGRYLYEKGFRPFILPNYCPACLTVRDFTNIFSVGRYIIGTGSHAVAVINGNHYDSWDSSSEICSFYWTIN